MIKRFANGTVLTRKDGKSFSNGAKKAFVEGMGRSSHGTMLYLLGNAGEIGVLQAHRVCEAKEPTNTEEAAPTTIGDLIRQQMEKLSEAAEEAAKPKAFYMVAAEPDVTGNEYRDNYGTRNSPPRVRFASEEQAHTVAKEMTRKYGYAFYVMKAIKRVERAPTPVNTVEL